MLPLLDDKQFRLLAAAMRRMESIQRKEAFDPAHPESRPTAAQQAVIDDFGTIPVQWIVAGSQSGKSQTCSRLISWAMENLHPTWKRPAEWGNEPILVLVCGRTGKQIEESLLPRLRSYLDPGTFKEIRVGNMIQRLEMANGDRIVFQSLENPNIARERIQSYSAHIVWLDEMAPTDEIVDELLRRVQARSGLFIASFTPLVENIAIQRRVDSAIPPYARKYQFAMLDNPVYQDPEKRAKILSEMSVLPESVRRTRLYGDWSSSNTAVYGFDHALMCRVVPDTYQKSWRHVESVDPALKSALGLGIFGEDPDTGKWYLVHSEEISGIHDPEELLNVVERRTSSYNIIKHIADPHEVWYIQLAARRGRKYVGVWSKNSRKGELIKQLQTKLGTVLFIPPHNTEFIDQLIGCKWADSDNSRIVSASSKHMLDMAQYFCDNIPKYTGLPHQMQWYEKLRMDNNTRIQMEHKVAIKQQIKRGTIRRRR